MLRPTLSPIIFVQQLGRGLRNVKRKDYLTVIDFIGNYENNYMIPIALFGDSSYNKDTLRKLITSGSALIPGSSTVNFDEIAQQNIFDSINSTNLNRKKDLMQDYLLLKHRIGKIPMMMDFFDSNSRDAYSFVEYSRSYLNFVNSAEDKITYDLPPDSAKLLEHLCKDINDGKRIEESLILSLLLQHQSIYISDLYKTLKNMFELEGNEEDIQGVIHNLNLKFITERYRGKTLSVGDPYNYEIASTYGGEIKIGESLSESLKYPLFREYLADSTQYSIMAFTKKYDYSNYVAGFQRYKKYSRKDAFRILGWKQNPNPQYVGGYIVGPDSSNCPIFVTYQKTDDISDSLKYEDRFVTPTTSTYMSKNRRTLNSPDVLAIKNQKENGIRLPLFIKKSNDEGLDFYFLGDLTTIDGSFTQEKMQIEGGADVSVVKMDFLLDKPVEQGLYSYITETI